MIGALVAVFYCMIALMGAISAFLFIMAFNRFL